MSLWMAKDYIGKALNRWDIDGKDWARKAIGEIEEAEAENKRLKEENRWIPVSERLPENIRDVWIVLKAKATNSYVGDSGFYSKEENKWEIYGEGLLTDVTHWKPIILPEQALKENDDKYQTTQGYAYRL